MNLSKHWCSASYFTEFFYWAVVAYSLPEHTITLEISALFMNLAAVEFLLVFSCCQ